MNRVHSPRLQSSLPTCRFGNLFIFICAMGGRMGVRMNRVHSPRLLQANSCSAASKVLPYLFMLRAAERRLA